MRNTSPLRLAVRFALPFRVLGLVALLLPLAARSAGAQAGTLDPTLDGDGIVATPVGDVSTAARVLVRPDGRFVLAGVTGTGSGSSAGVALAGYTAAGALDPTFGAAGIATVSYDGLDYVGGAALQADGKIIVVGRAAVNGFLVGRFTPSGAIDASFAAGDSWLTTSFGPDFTEATDVAVQPDGKIVVVGYTALDAGFNDVDWAVARYLPDGTLDATFSGDGMTTVSFGTLPDLAYGVAIQPDGRIVVAGSALTGGGTTAPFAVARLLDDGTLDGAFDGDGMAVLDVSATASHAHGFDVAVKPTGEIVVAGNVWSATDDPAFAVAQFTSLGAPDAAFGGGDGWAQTDLYAYSCALSVCEQANSVRVEADGKLVLGGFASTTPANTTHHVVRFNADGSLDAGFATGGVFTSDGLGGTVADVAFAADGKILAAGGANGGFTALRLESGVSTAASLTASTAGWRLLGAPGGGLSVGTLASINLVQGVSDEFPTFGANLFTGYTGDRTQPNGGYTIPAAKATPLTPGRGLLWYFYSAGGPDPSDTRGTSRRADLPLTLYALGNALTANVVVPFADNSDAGDDDFHMLANPFTQPFSVGGISVSGGFIQGGDLVQAYETGTGSYVLLHAADVVGVWQGFMAELVPTAPGGAVTVTYAAASQMPGATPPFYGRSAGGTLAMADPLRPSVGLALSGTLASGAVVNDQAALVRFDAAALPGWDGLDASKLTPPDPAYALLAPVVERDGAPTRVAADARPADALAAVPVAFTASEAGTFTLSWALSGAPAGAALPEGWTAELRDLTTGARVDLATATDYTFTAEAGDWAERFALVVTPAGVTATAPEAPRVTALSAARPNPTTGRTALRLTVEAPEHVRATVYDALGRAVAVVLDAEVAEAADVVVDGAGLAAGAYVVRVEGDTFHFTRRFTVTR